ncbi:MAG TPA: alpha-hydroxy acid oxidase [Gemmatimonadaceae bacterium]|nr:alpha-hydroxy acid oxidase [Gemmatimonadaceae bacterium]
MPASPPPDLSRFINIDDLEAGAREAVDAMIYDYYAAGAHDEITARENNAAFRRLALVPRVLVDVARRDGSIQLLGARHDSPLLIAPMAMQRLAHPDGELATARAAASAGVGMVVSTVSTTPIERIREVLPTPLWFQLYVYPDKALTQRLVERADRAGAQALVLTVDTPVLGRRERDVRNEFRLPSGLALAHEMPGGEQTLPHVHVESGLAVHAAGMLNPSLTWDDVDWLRSMTSMPVLLKGVIRGGDARRAVEHGVAGIIVSNHGGRQLDTALPTITALPAVANAVGGRIPVLLDGGIRRGTDILKALALGASAVLVGRAALWGLCCGGEAGVRHALEILRAELDLAMALCGARSIAEITPDLVAHH